MEQRFVENHHQERCTRFPQSCPNKCGVGILFRKDMEAHRKECPLEVIPCEYQSVGCEVKLVREKRKQHEMDSTQEHLQLTKSKLANTEERVRNLELMLHEKINKNNFSNFHGELQPMAQWSMHLGAMAALSQSGTQICPVIVKISAYLWDDDPISDSSDSMDSSIDSFPTDRSKDKCSSSFYTHNNGYKMCLQVDLGVHGEDHYLSVYCNYLKGPNDDKLTWPPRDTFEIKLLNHVSDSQHHSKLITCEDYIDDDDRDTNTTYALGYKNFILKSDLNGSSTTCQFVKCNLMYFKICML